jgi:predicted RNA-binding protein with PIN domain
VQCPRTTDYPLILYGFLQGAVVLTYLIDANNVIHRHPMLREQAKKDIEGAGERFIALMSGFAVRGGKKIVVVFDGTRHERKSVSLSLNIVIPASGENADQTIKTFINKSKNPRNLVIVSSDMEVARYGKLHACRIMSAAEFITLVSKKSDPEDEKPSTTSVKERDDWLKLFGGKAAE